MITKAQSKKPKTDQPPREQTPVKPTFELPLHDREESSSLLISMKTNGFVGKVWKSEDGSFTVDGRRREALAKKHNLKYEIETLPIRTKEEYEQMRLDLNLTGRSLTKELKADYAKTMILANPALSSRAIAKIVCLSKDTVETIKQRLIVDGEIRQPEKVVDAKGNEYAAVPRSMKPPEEQQKRTAKKPKKTKAGKKPESKTHTRPIKGTTFYEPIYMDGTIKSFSVTRETDNYYCYEQNGKKAKIKKDAVEATWYECRQRLVLYYNKVIEEYTQQLQQCQARLRTTMDLVEPRTIHQADQNTSILPNTNGKPLAQTSATRVVEPLEEVATEVPEVEVPQRLRRRHPK